MYKEYSAEFLSKIESTIKDFRNKTDSPLVAAFDADGTIWDTDVADIAFDYHIENWDLNLPENPLQHYAKLKENKPVAAYLWLAQILKGRKLEDVLSKNKEAFESWEKENGKIPVFPAQKQLIQFFQENGIEVFIVTASVKWSVHYGANMVNVPEDHILGVKTKIENGFITDEQDGPVTYRPGKAEAIKEKTEGKELIFCAGNTIGDYELLKCSKGISLAVRAANSSEELYETEEQLHQLAKEHNWDCHQFR
ncbi:MAG: haloacid dehalogenase-like hydrolase [Bdellovibrionota bacterium]|nr:haloacid dehalogenase-like hydrolase [Bdellovibrionota bacterium]